MMRGARSRSASDIIMVDEAGDFHQEGVDALHFAEYMPRALVDTAAIYHGLRFRRAISAATGA